MNRYLLLFLFSSIFLAACDDSSSDDGRLTSEQLAQKASEILYAVDEVTIDIHVENWQGIPDQVRRELRELPKGDQERVERKLADGQFQLLLNEVAIPFFLTPRGDFTESNELRREISGCLLEAKHRAEIKTAYDSVELYLKLDARLDGILCQGEFENLLRDTIENELKKYNLISLRRTYESLGPSLESLKSVRYEVRLHGSVK